VLTGWENEKEVKAYATGEVYDSSNATTAMPTLTRHDGGDAFTSNEIVTQNQAESQVQYQRRDNETTISDSERESEINNNSTEKVTVNKISTKEDLDYIRGMEAERYKTD